MKEEQNEAAPPPPPEEEAAPPPPPFEDVPTEAPIAPGPGYVVAPHESFSFLGLGGMYAFLLAIFIYGMSIPQTESGVEQVNGVFVFFGVIVLVAHFVLSIIKNNQMISSGAHAGRIGLTDSKVINIILFLLVLLVLPPVGVLYGFIMLSKLMAASAAKRSTTINPILKWFVILLSTIVSVAAGAGLIFIGAFALSIRACELSSSKCF